MLNAIVNACGAGRSCALGRRYRSLHVHNVSRSRHVHNVSRCNTTSSQDNNTTFGFGRECSQPPLLPRCQNPLPLETDRNSEMSPRVHMSNPHSLIALMVGFVQWSAHCMSGTARCHDRCKGLQSNKNNQHEEEHNSECI